MWDEAHHAARLELLLDVWQAWWRSRGDAGLDAIQRSNVIAMTGEKTAVLCDGVVMMIPGKGFKWDEEIVLQWLHVAAHIERKLLSKCNSTRPLLATVAAALLPFRIAAPPRVLLVFMNWSSIDVSVRNMHAVAEKHGLASVSSEHVVILPRVAHADYMMRCGEKAVRWRLRVSVSPEYN